MSPLSAAGALAIGALFGFTLQRGGFCGASILSSVVLYRDTKGLAGVGVAVLVSMVGFAFLAQMGWVIPNPSPMRLLSAVVGGLLFGAGMVLAGGCITGTLYKAAEGRLTSMLALVGIGIGAVSTNDGALVPMKRALVVATREIRGYAGLQDALDVSYPALAGLLGVVGLVAALVAHLIRRPSTRRSAPKTPGRFLRGGWSPVTAGAAVGILGWAAYLLSSAAGRNYPLSGQGGVSGAFSLLTTGEYSGSKWTIFMVAGLAAGSAISARMRKELKLRSADPATLLTALAGGALVGVGAAVGRGCFIGNNVSGLALLSLHSAVFAICTVAANWVTTLLYLQGVQR